MTRWESIIGRAHIARMSDRITARVLSRGEWAMFSSVVDDRTGVSLVVVADGKEQTVAAAKVAAEAAFAALPPGAGETRNPSDQWVAKEYGVMVLEATSMVATARQTGTWDIYVTDVEGRSYAIARGSAPTVIWAQVAAENALIDIMDAIKKAVEL